MRRKILISVMGMLILAIALSSVAIAGDRPYGKYGKKDRPYSKKFEGSGILVAQGKGVATLEGGGWVAVSGKGVLSIHDKAGDAIIKVSKKRGKELLADGTIRYLRFRGNAKITGSNFWVKFEGIVNLRAKGTGTVTLKGKGSYVVKKEQGKWSPTGVTLPLPN